MANRWRNNRNNDGFYFLGPQITVDDDCHHEIKIHVLLGRKAMTNIDSILKIRDITLSTKVYLLKSIVFPVVMYGCDGEGNGNPLQNYCLENPMDRGAW